MNLSDLNAVTARQRKCAWCPATGLVYAGCGGVPAGWAYIDCRQRVVQSPEVNAHIVYEDRGPLLCPDCLQEAAASL